MTRTSDVLPGGHRLLRAVKPTTALAPGESVKIPGLGAFTIAAGPIPMPHRQVCVPLGWSRLAIVAPHDAQWDAVSLDPPIWRHRPCLACGGSGRRPGSWREVYES